jgi:sedoheptulokinase
VLHQLHARLADLDWHENGCRIAHGYGVATLFWLVQQERLPAATRHVCTIADWLAAQLVGGQPATDPTLAASWGGYSLVNGAWNEGFLRRLGLDMRLFPAVRPSGELLSGLVPEVARQVGLPPGLPVFNAVGDTQASFLGSVADPQRAVLFNLGTGGQICWMVPEFEAPTTAVEIRPLPHGRYLRVGASLCGGAAYAWLNRTVRAWLAEFGVQVGEQAVYERLNALSEECDDTEGLQVKTTFLGVRGDPAVQVDPSAAAGSIEGVRLDQMRLGALARATLVGIVDELYELYRAHGGDAVGRTHLVATGGGVRCNPLLPRLIEERFGLPVQVPRAQETAATGAALLASGRWAASG